MAEEPCELDPRAARLLAMLRAGEAVQGAVPTPTERRESLRALADLAADPAPADIVCEALSCPAADGVDLPVRRYTPRAQEKRPQPALLYLHGGGWVAGDLDTHAGVCGALAAQSGCSVFALHYRRPPEHPFPGPILDALDALDWLRAEAPAFGVDPARLGLAGDSAGANLAAAVSHDPRRGAGDAPLALLLLICPILDLPRSAGSRTQFGQGFFLSAERLATDAADYLQGAPLQDPRVSPLLAPTLATAGVSLVHAAACDPFRDEALAYAARLQAEGAAVQATVHPGMIHYFYALPRAIPYARTALAAMGREVAEAFAEAQHA